MVALAAKRLNRPVSSSPRAARAYHFHYRAGKRGHRVRLGARRDGKLVATRTKAGNQFPPDQYVVAARRHRASLRVRCGKDQVTIVHADRSTQLHARPPMVPYMYALETAMDEPCRQARMILSKLRRVNDQ